MQDLELSGQVKWYLEIIKNAVESYENDSMKIYFDYDGVIGLLEQAQMLVTESARCPRPADLPDYLEWDEKMYDGDKPSEGYIFYNGMSAENCGIDDNEREGMEL